MHLLDGFRDLFECVPMVTEVSAGIAAEHFNETSMEGKKAFALVTTGPGLTNILTAIAGCYVEHRELLVIAGQVKSTDLLNGAERQRGVQEIDGTSICAPITVHSRCLTNPINEAEFSQIVGLSQLPHPGPVLIEICLDIQGKNVDEIDIKSSSKLDQNLAITISKSDIHFSLNMLKNSQRPLLLLGGLTSRKLSWQLLEIFERYGLPVATTTSAIDRVPSSSLVFAGRPGTWGGQRSANLILAQADLVIAVGAQLDLQQTGFNIESYAPSAQLIHVFPSQAELNRPGPPAIRKVFADPNCYLEEFATNLFWEDKIGWLKYVQKIRRLVPTLEPSNVSKEGYSDPFLFLQSLSKVANGSDILALCSSGGTFTGALQTYFLKEKQIATTSAAHASMGYGLATAIGASIANPSSKVILTEGEGGFSQNLQELAVIKSQNLPIKIFIMDNNGYASIRSTQKKFFGGAYLGCDPKTGLAFPNWQSLFKAYNIPCQHFEGKNTLLQDLAAALSRSDGPEAWVVKVDPDQTNWPVISSKIADDGSMTSSPIFDMLPELPPEIYRQVTTFLGK